MHPFQVGEHCLPVEHVTVVDTSVLDDLVKDWRTNGGDTIRAVEYRAYTIDYCPTCQTSGKILADNTTSKFLK